MEIQYTNHISVEEYGEVRHSVGWQEIPARQTERGLKNSLFITCARDGEKAVGLLRVLGDGGYTAVIADVMVRPEYQGRGIGKQLVQNAIKYIKGSLEPGDKILVYLMAAKGRETFYKQFGFLERPNEDYGAGMTQWFFDEEEGA